MPQIVSTGQITIVDNNDAKPITAFISGNIATNQMYSKDESTVVYTPSYSATPLTLTAKVYVGKAGGSDEVAALLTNRRWSNDLAASIGAGTTFVVNTNTLTPAAPNKTYYFEGDYTDPVTGLVSRVVASITLSQVTAGTNAVFIQLTGSDVIVQSDTATKNTAIMKADLIRASGIDNSGVTYQWFEMPANTPINQASIPAWATKYGFRTQAEADANAGSALGTGVPATAIYANVKAIIIGEPAVNSLGLYRVEAKDADGKVYQSYFTVHDVTDPYTVRLISTSGDKLQNGQGSTDIYPAVYNGSALVADQTGWQFKYYFADGIGTGNRGGFIDTTRTAQAGGRTITSNTASGVTLAAAVTVAADDMVKLVTAGGVAYFFEVSANSATATFGLRFPPTASNFLPNVPPGVNIFAGGKMYICTGTGATAGTITRNGDATPMGAKITVTGDEIDAKGTITCEAIRP